ncbi:UDP-N-acetyl-D-mannosamine dehydrogenase [compost metagenome]
MNDEKPNWVIEKLNIAIAELLKASPKRTTQEITIACFGLAFKPDIDDLRESPALEITKTIANQHPGRVLAVEPNIENNPFTELENVELVNIEKAFELADIILVLVDHKEIKELRIPRKNIKIIDTRGIKLL